MSFDHPSYLWLFLLFIPAVAWYIYKYKKATASLQISSTYAFDRMGESYKKYLRHLLFLLRLGTISCLIVVLARPQSTDYWSSQSTEGIDIVLSLDISSSMLACDFEPNRIDAAKSVAAQFVSGRPTDNIGLVIFAGESFTLCPMTTDRTVLLNMINEVACGMLEDRTAIGDGLATAVSRIKDSSAKSKVIILLTDGVNNTGSISPETAAQIAKTFGVRVYTVGIGTMGEAPYPVQTPYGITYQKMPVEIDEAVLQKIADMTGGKYYRATNKDVLKNIFSEIDKLEKSKMIVKEFSNKEELYFPWGMAALILLFVEMFLRRTLFRNIP
ncbi:MAG: VWA domain-containing protein [Porphyromonadaceae bacterium]|nr:VWA domain-containing protein [Porphyromonadaceae bacterium]